ncbi:hypothetical protein V8E36_000429 [Tilletia maclaganii]
MAAAAVAQWQPYSQPQHPHHHHSQHQHQHVSYDQADDYEHAAPSSTGAAAAAAAAAESASTVPVSAEVAAAQAAAAQAQAVSAAQAEAQRRSEEQRLFIISQPISQPSDEALDETGKSLKPANPNEFDPFYGRRVISELCERVIASLFECSLDSTAASMGAKGMEQRPTHRLSEFIAYALYRTRLPIQVTYQALYLLKRLKSRYPGARGSSGHRLFISALMLASKSTCDDTYSNKSWTIVGQGLFTLREVNQMERELFSYLGYRVNVANEALANFIDGLETGRFESVADLLNCNASIPLATVEALAAAATADCGDLCDAADLTLNQEEAEFEEAFEPVDAVDAPEAALPEPTAVVPSEQPTAEVDSEEASAAITVAEPTVNQQESVSPETYNMPTSSALERSNSVYVPRSRSAFSFQQQQQRASIAGYPLASYAGMSASLSVPRLPSYMQTNSAPATCAAPLRSIVGNSSAAAFESRPSSAHSHFRVLHSARDRCRPYTMPPQTANLHPHPYVQPFFPSAQHHSEHMRMPSSGGVEAELSQYYPSEYLSSAHCRSPSGRSTSSSFSSSGSSYASSVSSTSTSPSLYESRSQSSGFTTPETTTDMQLAYSPFGECENMEGAPRASFDAGAPECFVGKGGATEASYDWLRSHAAFAALQQKDNAAHGVQYPHGYPTVTR